MDKNYLKQTARQNILYNQVLSCTYGQYYSIACAYIFPNDPKRLDLILYGTKVRSSLANIGTTKISSFTLEPSAAKLVTTFTSLCILGNSIIN